MYVMATIVTVYILMCDEMSVDIWCISVSCRMNLIAYSLMFSVHFQAPS